MNAWKLLLVVVVLLSVAGLVRAQEDRPEDKKLGVTLDVTYLSRYIWRGFDIYPDNHSAIQPSIDLDFYGTGFGVNVLSSRANGSGFENEEELDFCLRYRNAFLAGTPTMTAYEIGWVYYSYPDRARKGPKVEGRPHVPVVESLADVQELYVVLAWPKILNVEGLVPNYIFSHVWPAQSDSNATDNGGWIHAFGLDYALPVGNLLSDSSQQVLDLRSQVVYNSGVGATGMVDHDWAYAVFGASMGFALSENLTFTPGIYYQLSMEDTCDADNETWFGLSLTYEF